MRRITFFTLAVVLLLAVAAPAAEVTFVHRAPGAKEVFLAGSFNGWSAFDVPMRDTGGGVWSIVKNLAPGEYQYKFVVDGAWTQDKANPAGAPDGYGGNNSVVKVPEGVAELVAGG
ncbi:glycogen-binding domain-containing protein, partial [bacterium]|nr:glycogen-binding domain-containing protein [bacterium]